MKRFQKCYVIISLIIILVCSSISVCADSNKNSSSGDLCGRNDSVKMFIKKKNEKQMFNLDSDFQDSICVEALDKNLTENEIEILINEKAKLKKDSISFLLNNGANLKKIKLLKDKDIIEITDIARREKLIAKDVKNITDNWAEVMYDTRVSVNSQWNGDVTNIIY